MTVLEAVKLTITKLEGISVPMKHIQTIGAPINEAITMLQASVQAMEDAELKEADAKEEAGE